MGIVNARTAVVVGGGIGGLAAAGALRRTGWEVTVLERAPQFGEVGAGITLFPNALRAFDEIGLGAAIRARGSWSGPGGTRTPDGRWVLRVGTTDDPLVAGSLGIHRAELHRLLCGALPADSLRAGVEVRDVRAGGTVITADGPIEAELVVGADGIDSITRRQLWPEAPRPRYLGSTAWRGVTAQPWAGPITVAETWGPGAAFGIVPLEDGRVYWFAAEAVPAGGGHPDEWSYLLDRFGGWHAPIAELLAATEPATVLRHDLAELPQLPGYVAGHVALLGDAAHAMAPTLGQGACQAVEDAVVLAAELRDTSVEEGLRRYDAARRPRTQAIARTSRAICRFGHQLRHPLAVLIRDRAIALTPPKVALRSTMGTVNWEPPPLSPVGPRER